MNSEKYKVVQPIRLQEIRSKEIQAVNKVITYFFENHKTLPSKYYNKKLK